MAPTSAVRRVTANLNAQELFGIVLKFKYGEIQGKICSRYIASPLVYGSQGCTKGYEALRNRESAGVTPYGGLLAPSYNSYMLTNADI